MVLRLILLLCACRRQHQQQTGRWYQLFISFQWQIMNQILQIMNVLCTFVLFFIILFLRLSILLTRFPLHIFFVFFFL